MINFKLFFEQKQISPPGDTTALLPGGFKPPTRGHVGVLENLLSNASNGVVFIVRVREMVLHKTWQHRYGRYMPLIYQNLFKSLRALCLP